MIGGMEAWATTILDTLGILVFAAGVGAGVSPWLGWFGLAVSGAIILLCSLVAHRRLGDGQ